MVHKALTLALVAKLVDAAVEHGTAAVPTGPMLLRLPERVSLEKALSKSSSRGKANLVKNLPQR